MELYILHASYYCATILKIIVVDVLINSCNMSLLRRKGDSYNLKEQPNQFKLTSESNVNFSESKDENTESERVFYIREYLKFLNDFVFENSKNHDSGKKQISLYDDRDELSMEFCDDDVFTSAIDEESSSKTRNSYRRSLMRFAEFIHRLSAKCKNLHSKTSDYGSLASNSMSSTTEGGSPDEAIPLKPQSDCAKISESGIDASEKKDSSDSMNSNMELLRCFAYESYNCEKLLWEILSAVRSLTGTDDSYNLEVSFPLLSNALSSKFVKAGEVKAFLKDIFEVSIEKLEEIISAVGKEKVTKVNLNLNILEGKMQRPKNFLGSRNLYVTINIPNTNQCFKTRTERTTLNPKWNENFILDIASWSSDILQLEVWTEFEHHDFQRVLHRGKKSKLIGSLQIPIKHIMESGINEWFSLKNASLKATGKSQSLIHIRGEVCIASDQWRCNNRASYEALLAKVVYNHVKMCNNESELQRVKYFCWNGDLSHVALFTLTQHSVFLGLKHSALCLSWWIISSTVSSVEFGYLLKLLLEVQNHMINKSYSDIELEQLTVSIGNWIKLAIEKLLYLKINFPPSRCANEKHQFDLFLRICVNLQSHPESSRLLESTGINDLITQMQNAVIDFAKGWWSNLVEEQLRGVIKPEEQLKAAVLITSETFTFLEEIATFYGPALLSEVKLLYFRDMFIMLTNNLSHCVYPPLMITYNQMGLSNELQWLGLENRNGNKSFAYGLGSLWMDLYNNLGALLKLSSTLPLEVQSESRIHGYHKWFERAIPYWLDIYNQRSLVMIHKAVQTDTLEATDEYRNFSFSAVETIAIMLEIKKLWKNLDWPEPENTLILLPKILEIICTSIIDYIDQLIKKVQVFNDGPNTRQFSNYKRICIGLNNIERIRGELPLMFESDITLAKIYIAQVNGEEAADTFINNAKLIIENAVKNINIEANELIETVIEKICDDSRCNTLVKTCKLYDAVIEDFLNPLFKVIYCTMNERNFIWFIRRFWEVFVGLFKTMVMENIGKQDASFFNEIYVILEDFVKFVSLFDEVDIFKEVFISKDYIDLKEQLQYLKMSSESLISKYFSERLDEQSQATISCKAKLVARAYFTSYGKLTVEVLMAENMEFNQDFGCLPAIRRRKECADSYVSAELVPSAWFKNVQKVRTRTQWNSDPAVFNELFDLEITQLDGSRLNNGFILFTMRDMIRRRSSTLIGESLVPLRDLTHKVQNLYLNVTTPGIDNGYQTLPLLKQRTLDDIASSFLKERSSLSYKFYDRNLRKFS